MYVFRLSNVYQVLNQLRPVSSNVLDRLEHVHFPVLDDLFYASVGSKINSDARGSVSVQSGCYICTYKCVENNCK